MNEGKVIVHQSVEELMTERKTEKISESIISILKEMTMNNIAKFIFFDILKNKIVLLYTLLLFVISWSVLGLDSNYTKATLSLLNIVLLVVPLVEHYFSDLCV